MLETQLQKLLISTIRAGISAWPGVALPANLSVEQAFQPRQQGVPINPCVTIFHVGPARNVGYPKWINYIDPDTQLPMRMQRQRIESTYRIGALVPQSPATPNALTEVDVLNIVSTIMQSTDVLVALNAQDVGVLRIQQVDSNYFTDDKSQNENNPIFVIILTHKNEVSYSDKSISSVQSAGIYPI